MKKADMKSWHVAISILAVLFFTFLLSRGYGDAEFLMRQGNYYFGQGTYDLEKAGGFFKRAVRVEPGILWGHYQLARIYFLKSDFPKAIDEINKELEANPENLRSLYVRGLINGYAGKLAEAEADFARFVQWAPKEWAGYNDLAWISASRGKYEEARDVILKAFEEVPKAQENPWLWNSLGVAQLNLKDYQKAETAFEKAKEFAGKLTLEEWQRAYPGNNPQGIGRGLEAFKKAIGDNLEKAKLKRGG